jgi:hypothetical protein
LDHLPRTLIMATRDDNAMRSEDPLATYLIDGSTHQDLPDNARQLRALLATQPVWSDPPATTLPAILMQIRAERATPVDGFPALDTGRARAPQRLWSRRMLLASAAVAIFAAGGLTGWLAAPASNDQAGDRVALAGTDLAPSATAVAQVQETAGGVAISLRTAGLAPAAPGTFYQAWLKSPDGDLVAAGTFHLRGGNRTIQLWAGVDASRYHTLTVTVQYERNGTQSSGLVVLRGEIPTHR